MDIINPLLNISIPVLSRWLLLAKLPLFTAHEKTSSANLFWAPNRFPEAVPCIKTHFCFISSCWRQAQGEEMQCWGHQQNAAMHHYNTDLWTVVHVTGDMENTHSPIHPSKRNRRILYCSSGILLNTTEIWAPIFLSSTHSQHSSAQWDSQPSAPQHLLGHPQPFFRAQAPMTNAWRGEKKEKHH